MHLEYQKYSDYLLFFFFQAEDGIRDLTVTGVQTCALPIFEYRADRAQSYVALKRSGSEKQWKFPDALGSYHSDVDVTAEVIFAGYGITAPELAYDDYQDIDAHGKIDRKSTRLNSSHSQISYAVFCLK